MDRDKHPELAKEYDRLAEQRAAILAELAPLEAETTARRAEADAAWAKWAELRKRIAGVEAERGLRKLSQRLAVLARAMGARSLAAEGARPPAPTQH